MNATPDDPAAPPAPEREWCPGSFEPVKPNWIMTYTCPVCGADGVRFRIEKGAYMMAKHWPGSTVRTSPPTWSELVQSALAETPDSPPTELHRRVITWLATGAQSKASYIAQEHRVPEDEVLAVLDHLRILGFAKCVSASQLWQRSVPTGKGAL